MRRVMVALAAGSVCAACFPDFDGLSSGPGSGGQAATGSGASGGSLGGAAGNTGGTAGAGAGGAAGAGTGGGAGTGASAGAVLTVGFQHTCAILQDSSLWCWGDDSLGQVGLSSGDRWTPGRVLIPGGPDAGWSDISAGSFFTCGINAGSLYCWGQDKYGEAGGAKVPTIRTSGSDWQRVIAALQSACALKKDGALYCWGRNDFGAVGIGITSGPVVEPTPVVGPVSAWSQVFPLDGKNGFCGLPFGSQAGSTYCWGDDFTPTPSAPAELANTSHWSLAGGSGFQCGLRTDGSVWCWGDNEAGQLGIDDTVTMKSTPFPVVGSQKWAFLASGHKSSCALNSAGVPYYWGRTLDDMQDIRAPTPLAGNNWEVCAVDRKHACGKRANEVFCWGQSSQGALGIGPSPPAWVPQPVAVSF